MPLKYFNIIFILSTICSSLSCQKPDSNSDYEIYSIIINSQSPPASEWRETNVYDKSLFLPPDGLKNSEDSLKFQRLSKELDSINSFRRQAQLILAIEDSTIILNETRKLQINELSFDDPERLHLIAELLSDSTSSGIDILQLKKPDYYDIISADETSVDSNNSIVTHVLKFSKISYSEDGSSACIYFSSICGSECGSGSLFFLELDGEKWIISEEIFLWVA